MFGSMNIHQLQIVSFVALLLGGKQSGRRSHRETEYFEIKTQISICYDQCGPSIQTFLRKQFGGLFRQNLHLEFVVGLLMFVGRPFAPHPDDHVIGGCHTVRTMAFDALVIGHI